MSDYADFYKEYCELCRKYKHYVGSWDGEPQIVPMYVGLSQTKIFTKEELESHLRAVNCEEYVRSLIKRD